ncbi:MAG: aminoglycoside phosphotransferase family protein [Gemmatimonadaceae bacterium]|nr:aminoglycoside phosphotransferase family protein [Gemmatimonadaceae bacterium]
MSGHRHVPADAALPHLSRLLDLPAVGAVAGEILTRRERRPSRVRDCIVERVKYRPGRNAVVAYRLRVETPGAFAPVERLLCLATYPAAEAAARVEKARGGAATDDVQWVPAWDTLARVFPADRKLPALAGLADAATALREQLPPLVAARWPSAGGLRNARHRVVSYFPDHTCTVRMDADVLLPEAAVMPWQVYGKTRYDDAGAVTFRLMQGLSAGASDGVEFARALSYDPSTRVLWQEGVPLPTLHDVLASHGGSAALLRRVARAVAVLHASDIVDLPPAEGAVLEDVGSAAAIVGRALPDLAVRTGRLADALRERAPDVPPVGRATLHGDLHSRNVLIGQTRVALIDLDRVHAGDPARELGSLLAEFAWRDCATGRPFDSRSVGALLEGYAERASRGPEPSAVLWHFAAALLHERARRAVTSLKPGWRDVLPSVLDLAARLLTGAAGQATRRNRARVSA